MRGWKKLVNHLLQGRTRLEKNHKFLVKNADGSETTITNDELKNAVDTGTSVETLAAAKTLTAADSGKTFFLGLAGGFTVTLPAPVAGMEFTFIVSVAPTTAYIIVTNGGADIIVVGINELEVDTADDGPYDINADTLNFVASTAVVGDYVSFKCDGTKWYGIGQTNADGGITTSTTRVSHSSPSEPISGLSNSVTPPNASVMSSRSGRLALPSPAKMIRSAARASSVAPWLKTIGEVTCASAG